MFSQCSNSTIRICTCRRGKWFLLVSEPTSAPDIHQPRREISTTVKSTEPEPLISSVTQVCTDQLPATAGVQNNMAPRQKITCANAGTHSNRHHLPKASRTIGAVNSHLPVPSTPALSTHFSIHIC